ncbi:MAG: hypothetical protein GX495_17210 [Chloroflexi bacterium]|jgi:predicted  nucleic acid-binding Zn-ribbon protein|nr:hypothetical protein [Chloroflexota bacterium]
MSQVFKLYRLQQTDSQIDRARQRLKEIAIALAADEAVKQARATFATAEQELSAAQKALRRAEENLRDQNLKIEQSEATLYGGRVRNPKELQDLQNEVAALKRYRSVLEDRQLEEMIALEEAEARHLAAREELERVEADFAERNKALTSEQKNLENELARLNGERQATQASIPAEDLQLYEQLRRQRSGVAVARITDRACSACGTTLSASLLHAARSPSQITRCDGCGRILYSG